MELLVLTSNYNIKYSVQPSHILVFRSIYNSGLGKNMDLCYNIEQVTLLEESGKVKVGWKWINKELDGNIQLRGKVHKILYF